MGTRLFDAIIQLTGIQSAFQYTSFLGDKFNLLSRKEAEYEALFMCCVKLVILMTIEYLEDGNVN